MFLCLTYLILIILYKVGCDDDTTADEWKTKTQSLKRLTQSCFLKPLCYSKP
jgi:hypothetical protein